VRIGRFESKRQERFWGAIRAESDGTVLVRRLLGGFADWAPRVALASELDDALAGPSYRFADLRVLAPRDTGARVFGTGINYGSHLLDAKNPSHRHPPTPPGYIKIDSTIVDPGEEIRYPTTTNSLDYEVELVAVVARHLVVGERGRRPCSATRSATTSVTVTSFARNPESVRRPISTRERPSIARRRSARGSRRSPTWAAWVSRSCASLSASTANCAKTTRPRICISGLRRSWPG
jgi:hypothetical protein